MAVIGAGSSGLAVLKALREHGVAVDCFERGSEVGGLWRYENDAEDGNHDHPDRRTIRMILRYWREWTTFENADAYERNAALLRLAG